MQHLLIQQPPTLHAMTRSRSTSFATILNNVKLAGFSLFMSLSLAASAQENTQTTNSPALSNTVIAKHGVAMHGEVKYPADFKHFDYVNPNAPKGGTVRRSVVSNSYDSFHPFVLKGVPAAGVGHYLYDTLTIQSEDEAFSQYGLIAEKIEMPEDRSWVTFHINPKAGPKFFF